MAFWDLHAAWFYKQLAVIGEWGSGFQDYALDQQPQPPDPACRSRASTSRPATC